jgi:hypothetical protein
VHHQQFLYNYSNASQPQSRYNPHSATASNSQQWENQQASLGARKRPREEQEKTPSQWKCEPCKLSFDSKGALRAHSGSHETCTACDFSAAPKVVKGHFQAVHGRFSVSGFKSVTVSVPGCQIQRFRICVGNRPEDVEKWIEERRKRFPRKKTAVTAQDDKIEATPKEEKRGLSSGLSSLLDGYGSSSSEEEEGKKVAVEKKAETPPTPVPQQQSTQVGGNRRPCRYFVRNGTCRNGDKCTFSHDVASNAAFAANQDRRFPKNNRNTKIVPDSLLRKLFVNDVRRETVLTLQLLEYIVDSDFLQKPKSDEK